MGSPKKLIEALSEDMLATFKTAPLVDAYGIYQHLMDYWADVMQDDCYLIALDGWVAGAQPREILQVKNKENKLVWPEPHDLHLRTEIRISIPVSTTQLQSLALPESPSTAPIPIKSSRRNDYRGYYLFCAAPNFNTVPLSEHSPAFFGI